MTILRNTLAASVLVGFVTTVAAQPTLEDSTTMECPEFVRGAKLRVSNITGGVQLDVLAGAPIHVAALRQMVRELAMFIEAHEPPIDRQLVTHPQDQLEFPIDIDVDSLAGGARVAVKADKRADIRALREKAKMVQEIWDSSQCINGEQSTTAQF
jgi:hypothetical protein